MARFTARTDAAEPPVKELQLATLVTEAPEGPDWLHEQKFDGYRILAERDGASVRLLSRRFKDWTAAFPEVAQAVAKLPGKRIVLDGEVAAVMPDGRTSFQALQNARAAGAQLAYFVFDLLELDGERIAARPLAERKARLEALVRGHPGVIRYSDHVEGSGKAFFALACKQGLEGIISKRRDRPYTPGRGPSWVKTKCLLRQELVIGGYTDPEGSRAGIGALLVGYYEAGELKYAGKVGTGFSHALLGELRARLAPLEQAASAFVPEPPRAWTGGGRHWVAPTLVGEVAFSEWTNDGRLRHPSFQGLREDKLATDVVREAPVSSGAVAKPKAAKAAKPRTAKPKAAKPRPARKRAP
jgi:bifunctional non-homologous end joining protein LigD